MGTAELKPGVRYDMPPAFGPSIAPDVEEGFEIHASNVEFQTTAEAVELLLPKWFKPAPRPIVSIGYRQMIGMQWMGGRNYQIVRVGLSAEYDLPGGKGATSFGLVLWESDCAPILAGRELMGAPKLFGHIPPIEVSRADHQFECREYDAPLIRGRAYGLEELSEAAVAQRRSQQTNSWVCYWKYIPGVEGAPDADYPVAIKLTTPFTRMWSGTGDVEFCQPSSQEAPYSSHIVKRLAEVPRLTEPTSTAWHASGCTLRRDQTRRLDRPRPER